MARTFRKQEQRDKPRRLKEDAEKKTSTKQKHYFIDDEDDEFEQ